MEPAELRQLLAQACPTSAEAHGRAELLTALLAAGALLSFWALGVGLSPERPPAGPSEPGDPKLREQLKGLAAQNASLQQQLDQCGPARPRICAANEAWAETAPADPGRVAGLEVERDRLAAQNRELSDRSDRLQKQIQLLQMVAQQQQPDQAASLLEAENKRLEAEKNELARQLQELVIDPELEQERIEAADMLQAENARLEAENRMLSSGGAKDQLQALQSEKQALANTAVSLEAKNRSLTERIDSLAELGESLTAQNQGLVQHNQELAHKLERLSAKKAQQSEQLRKSEADREQLKQEMGRLVAEVQKIMDPESNPQADGWLKEQLQKHE